MRVTLTRRDTCAMCGRSAAREQARDAVIAAARNVEWADHDHYQRNPGAHLEHLRAALAALDAEGK